MRNKKQSGKAKKNKRKKTRAPQIDKAVIEATVKLLDRVQKDSELGLPTNSEILSVDLDAPLEALQHFIRYLAKRPGIQLSIYEAKSGSTYCYHKQYVGREEVIELAEKDFAFDSAVRKWFLAETDAEAETARLAFVENFKSEAA